MTAYGKVKVQLHTFLTSVLSGMCGQLYIPAALPPARELQVPCEEAVGGGGCTTGLDASGKRHLLHLPQIEPRNIQLPPRCLVTVPTEQRWVPTETSSEVKQSSGTAEASQFVQPAPDEVPGSRRLRRSKRHKGAGASEDAKLKSQR
jgi:hypothetical protein